ncbi:MAG: hypothetical protein ABI877_18970 [Gemmatimonadaceae bacterium]
MIRFVRHFATRQKRATLPARATSEHPASVNKTLAASAWVQFERWLAIEPIVDSVAAREHALAWEDARVTAVLIGQAGEEVVSRISQARVTQRLLNDSGAHFALAFAVERGDAETRSAASEELAALA